MLKEFLDRVVELGAKGSLARVFKCDAEPPHIYYLENSDGHVSRVCAEATPRAHSASDLSAIVQFAVLANVEGNPEIWYSRERVQVFWDANARRDKVFLPMGLSQQVRLLLELQRPPHRNFGQKDFVKLLRISLNGAAGPGLINAVRQVKFRVDSQGASEVQHGKSSIGKQLRAELTGEGTIPDEVTLEVPVFEGYLAWKLFQVRCAIEIDAGNESFQLIPFPGEVERAIRQAEECLGQLLRDRLTEAQDLQGPTEDDIPVLYGTP